MKASLAHGNHENMAKDRGKSTKNMEKSPKTMQKWPKTAEDPPKSPASPGRRGPPRAFRPPPRPQLLDIQQTRLLGRLILLVALVAELRQVLRVRLRLVDASRCCSGSL